MDLFSALQAENTNDSVKLFVNIWSSVHCTVFLTYFLV